jgi:alkanesulfonate monooxygenase SsuD/methylene tetrahydromethanopterin reductase-like flavin-dependent oxidoreductase (luciferase family)
MRLGLYFEMQTPPGKDHHRVYWEVMNQIEAADALGFDVVSLVEHHCQEQFSISANPLAVFTAAAQRTRRVRFRTALHTLPLHNPIRLAGEIATADILTNGRLECGIGRGHPWNFISAGVPMEESRGRFDEVLAILEQAWTRPTVEFDGVFYSIHGQIVVPRPVQKPHPKFFAKLGDPRAARKGWGALVAPVFTLEEVAAPLASYAAESTAHGHEPDAVIVRAVYADEDPDQARREAEGALHNFLAYNAAPVAGLPPKEELEAKGYGTYGGGRLASLARLSYEEILDRELALVGTPETVASRLRRIGQTPGVTEIAVIANFGGIEHWKALKTLDLFSRRVVPLLHEVAPS